VTEHVLTDADSPLSLGDPDGYGRYGVLEEQPGGLVCHECGRTFPSLGLHAYRGHGMTAGLITAELRARIRDKVFTDCPVDQVSSACRRWVPNRLATKSLGSTARQIAGPTGPSHRSGLCIHRRLASTRSR
jgi:hypothetical protein